MFVLYLCFSQINIGIVSGLYVVVFADILRQMSAYHVVSGLLFLHTISSEVTRG